MGVIKYVCDMANSRLQHNSETEAPYVDTDILDMRGSKMKPVISASNYLWFNIILSKAHNWICMSAELYAKTLIIYNILEHTASIIPWTFNWLIYDGTVLMNTIWHLPQILLIVVVLRARCTLWIMQLINKNVHVHWREHAIKLLLYLS